MNFSHTFSKGEGGMLKIMILYYMFLGNNEKDERAVVKKPERSQNTQSLY